MNGYVKPMVQGDVKHDDVEPASSRPISIGAIAKNNGAAPTAVAAGDRVRIPSDRHGVPWVQGGHPNTTAVNRRSTAAETHTFVTPATGKKIVVYSVEAMCDNANTNDTGAQFKLGTTVIRSHPGIAAGSGFVSAPGGIIAVGAANEALAVTVENPGGTIDTSVTYAEVDG